MRTLGVASLVAMTVAVGGCQQQVQQAGPGTSPGPGSNDTLCSNVSERRAGMDEFVTTSSEYPVRETMDRLEAAAREHGMMIFARIDHAKGAASVGLSLRPMELLIFGNPRAGTLLIPANPQIGIDLPLRALVWQDEAERTWISAVNPGYLVEHRG